MSYTYTNTREDLLFFYAIMDLNTIGLLRMIYILTLLPWVKCT